MRSTVLCAFQAAALLCVLAACTAPVPVAESPEEERRQEANMPIVPPGAPPPSSSGGLQGPPGHPCSGLTKPN